MSFPCVPACTRLAGTNAASQGPSDNKMALVNRKCPGRKSRKFQLRSEKRYRRKVYQSKGVVFRIDLGMEVVHLHSWSRKRETRQTVDVKLHAPRGQI